MRAVLAAVVLVLLAELPLLIPPPFPLTDHLVFWKAGQLVVTGGSPYDMSAWAETQRAFSSPHLLPFIQLDHPVWVYPAWTALLFAPFGLLPPTVGPWAIDISYLVVGLLATVLFARALPEPWRRSALVALPIAAMFQPLVIANRDGQFGAFLLLGTVLVFFGLRDRSALPLIAGSLLLFTKPQLFVLVAAVVVAILARRRAWGTIAATTLVLAAVAILSTLRYPESLAVFARGAGDRAAVFATYSTTWSFAHYFFGDLWPIVGGVLAATATAAIAAGVWWLPRDLRLAGAVGGAAAASILVVPVDLHYDQVPLILVVVLAVAVARHPLQLAGVWIAAVVIPWLLELAGLFGGGPDSQALSGAAPVLIALAFSAAARSSARPVAEPLTPTHAAA